MLQQFGYSVKVHSISTVKCSTFFLFLSPLPNSVIWLSPPGPCLGSTGLPYPTHHPFVCGRVVTESIREEASHCFVDQGLE